MYDMPVCIFHNLQRTSKRKRAKGQFEISSNQKPKTWVETFPILSVNHSVLSDSLRPHELQPARLLCPWNSPARILEWGTHSLLQGIFLTQRSNPVSCIASLFSEPPCIMGGDFFVVFPILLLSRFSRVQLCVTLQTAPHQTLPSLGFSRQEHWSGLPFPSPMHESEKFPILTFIKNQEFQWACYRFYYFHSAIQDVII